MADDPMAVLLDDLYTLAAAIAWTSPITNTVTVYDGPGVSDNPGDYLMLGVSDPDATHPTVVASSLEDWANLGQQADRDIDATTDHTAMSWNGQNNMALARRTVYAIRNQFCTALRGQSDPSLGISTLLWTSAAVASDLKQVQGASGARAVLHFRIKHRARI